MPKFDYMAQQQETKSIKDHFRRLFTQNRIAQAPLNHNTLKLPPRLIHMEQDCALKGSPFQIFNYSIIEQITRHK